MFIQLPFLFQPPGNELIYLDPGSGSFILQMIIAGAAGFLFLIRGRISNFIAFVRGGKKSKTRNKSK